MPPGVTGVASAKSRIDSIVSDYAKHPAFAGYFLVDEPGELRLALADPADQPQRVEGEGKPGADRDDRAEDAREKRFCVRSLCRVLVGRPC